MASLQAKELVLTPGSDKREGRQALLVSVLVLSDPAVLTEEWGRMYTALAAQVARRLPRSSAPILEVGCGQGQFTIPLALSATGIEIVAVDSYRGHYANGRQKLLATLQGKGLAGQVAVKRSEALRWLRRQRVPVFQAVVSSEFLPEVTTAEMREFFRECFHAILPGGTTVHVYLSSTPRNRAQRLVITGDSNPRWTRHPPREWFSPPSPIARASLEEAGFLRVRVAKVQVRVRLVRAAAVQQLERWGVRRAFARENGIDRGLRAIELPDWIVLSGVKPS